MPQTRSQTRKRDHCDDTTSPTDTKRPRQLSNDAFDPLTYRQLDLKGHQIRILHIRPGDYKDPIRCVLHTAFLDDDPKYEALSYAWGDPLNCRPIEVDGRLKNVTVNLFHALRRLRYPRRERHLWVDALCINQDNKDEKSHQVNLMSKIYSRTERAILWLGDFSNGRTAATNQIPRRAAMKAFALVRSMAANHHYDPNHEEADRELVEKGLAGLSSLTQLPWWHRGWTVQEAVLPENAIVVCGTAQLSFSQFLRANSNRERHSKQGCCRYQPHLGEFRTQLNHLQAARGRCKNRIPGCISDAIVLFRARHVSDPRDRIYAFLGLGSDIVANYSLSDEEVFKLTTRSLIKESGTLVSLLRLDEERRSPILPTWVPDWSVDSNVSRWLTVGLGWYTMHYWYQAAIEVEVETRASRSDATLDLKGFVLDRVGAVGHVLDTRESMMEMLDQWQDNRNSKEYPRGGTYREASWRTLIADMKIGPDTPRRLTSSDDAEEIATKKLERKYDRIHTYRRRGFWTDTGMIGAGNRDIRVGDSVCILAGGHMPYILRRVEGEEGDIAYQFIGQAYVHGIMSGEALNEGREWEWISLV